MSNMFPAVFGENLMDVFNDFDRNFFRGFPGMEHGRAFGPASGLMKTDVKETDGAYELDVEMPGFAREEIRLELENGYLTITAEKTDERNDENSEGKILRRERYAGMMSRSFRVGGYVTEEDIKAAYDNGVLHITVPKKEAKVPEKKTILIA